MSFFSTRERSELDKVAQVEGEIRDFVRQRDNSGGESLQVADKLASLIGRVTGSSIQEIDGVTAGLQALRGQLQSQGERVQRDVAVYASLSQSAMQSAKVISEKLEQWKKSAKLGAKETESPSPDPAPPYDCA